MGGTPAFPAGGPQTQIAKQQLSIIWRHVKLCNRCYVTWLNNSAYLKLVGVVGKMGVVAQFFRAHIVKHPLRIPANYEHTAHETEHAHKLN